jgi:hypothetical protein
VGLKDLVRKHVLYSLFSAFQDANLAAEIENVIMEITSHPLLFQG